jgi:inner membrane protein
MDNLCHTVAGAVLAEAGLRRRTPLALPTLLLGANLPDLDALAYARGSLFALTFRRGWTHGVLALVLLPVLLTAVMLTWDRLVRSRHATPRADPAALLLLATIAVLSHPLLDLLNTYGVRLLMPFSNRWFYADTLFIVDPWLWLLFGGGAAIAWRRRRQGRSQSAAERPARIALALAVGYIVVMGILALVGRRVVREAAFAAGITPVSREMLSPVLANPFRRSVVLATPDGYRLGAFNWLGSPGGSFEPRTVPSGLGLPAVVAATASAAGLAFLSWSRFPVAVVHQNARGEIVRLYDLRYAGPEGRSWAAVEIPVKAAPAPLPPAPALHSCAFQTAAAGRRSRCRSPG